MRVEVHAERLLCPMPVIRLQEAAKGLASGTEVLVHCTDPGAQYDIPAWCRVHHHELLSITEDDDGLHVLIKLN